MRVLVLGGGDEPERAVSLRSAAAMAKSLSALGHEVTQVDPVTLSHHGLMQELRRAEIVFPILHGVGGEDGSIQELLEASGTPYLGSNAEVSRRCFDKLALKAHLQGHGLPFAAHHTVDSLSYYTSVLRDRPHVVKPVASGSSIDTHIVRSLQTAAAQVHESLLKYRQMMLEELIEGIEVTVPVLGDEALPVIEIVPPQGEEFDYENKYNGKTREVCPAESLSESLQEEAQRLALAAHRLAGCRHLSRTDMIVRADGSIVLLEVNTMPGMTEQSLFPKAARVAGYSDAGLAERFIELVLR